MAAGLFRLSRFLLVAGAVACGSAGSGGTIIEPPDPPTGDPPRTLRDLATDHGRGIGTAVDRLFVLPEASGGQYMTILGREFSVLTLENDMKHQRLRPSHGDFRFTRADSMVAYADGKGMAVRGHTLVWHQQLAAWLTSGTWTADEARELLRDHVMTVAAHYRGRVFAWDVVNEAFGDDAVRRSSFWANNVGPDYIEMSFRWAHEADPDALLFYNDYNIEGISAKSDSTYTLVRDLIDRGVPIHGIGFQGHFTAGTLPSRAQLLQNFTRFADLGLKIHITELDIRVQTPASSADLTQQAEDFRTVIDVCLVTPACDTVVFWGFTDRDSWIPTTFPGWGQPLLYDSNYIPKQSYWSVYNRLRQTTS